MPGAALPVQPRFDAIRERDRMPRRSTLKSTPCENSDGAYANTGLTMPFVPSTSDFSSFCDRLRFIAGRLPDQRSLGRKRRWCMMKKASGFLLTFPM